MELAKFNKVHYFDNSLVDEEEKKIKGLEKNPDFDDPHILALSIISKAKIICSDDSRSFKFIRKIKEYEPNAEIPKIYTTIEHEPQTSLLCDTNICSNGVHNILNKAIADKIWKKIETNF